MYRNILLPQKIIKSTVSSQTPEDIHLCHILYWNIKRRLWMFRPVIIDFHRRILKRIVLFVP